MTDWTSITEHPTYRKWQTETLAMLHNAQMAERLVADADDRPARRADLKIEGDTIRVVFTDRPDYVTTPPVVDTHQSEEPPEVLVWILTDRHRKAWISAANWVHTHLHVDAPFSYDRSTPCAHCWRASAYALKGAIMAGYGPES